MNLRGLLWRTGASAVVAVAATALMSGAPAHAQGSLSCTGSVTVEYGPPLGPLPQPTTQVVTERLGAHGGGFCVGPVGEGIATTVFDQEVGCLLQGLGDTLVQNEVTYHWDGGASSTVTYEVTTVAHVGNQLIVTSTGTVTEGLRQGSPSQRIAIYAEPDVAACLTSGVERQAGSLTVTIL